MSRRDEAVDKALSVWMRFMGKAPTAQEAIALGLIIADTFDIADREDNG